MRIYNEEEKNLIIKAHAILSDSYKRQQYDKDGKYNTNVTEAEQDLFNDLQKSDVGFIKAKKPFFNLNKGRNIFHEVTVSIDDIVKQKEIVINFNANRNCKDCKGTGTNHKILPRKCLNCGGTGIDLYKAYISESRPSCKDCNGSGCKISNPCSTCAGVGVVHKPVTLKTKLPVDVMENPTCIIPEEGHYGNRLGPKGDLLLKVQIESGSPIRKENDLLFVKVPVKLSTLVLGGRIIIPTYVGERSVTIPPGSQFDFKHILKECGIKLGDKRGDIQVELMVEFPKSPTPLQTQLMREFSTKEKPVDMENPFQV